MRIHHVGYLVDEVSEATAVMANLGFHKIGEMIEDKSREVYIQFLENEGYVIELIQPVSELSPIYPLRKKYKNSPYHICYETADIEREVGILCDGGGYMEMTRPTSAPAIEGSPKVVFLMNAQIGMIELVESIEREESTNEIARNECGALLPRGII